MSSSSSQSQSTATPSKGAVSTPDKIPSRKQYRDAVTLVVGSDKKNFTIHKELLVFYSDYFRAAFNGSFVEARIKKIELFDVNQEVFEHFHAWLYMRKLASDDDKPLEWVDLVNLWVFGDRFQVPLLQNCVMDELWTKWDSGECFRIGMLKYIYRETVQGSPLRKFVIEVMAYTTDLGDENDSMMAADLRQFYTVEILQDIIKGMYTGRENKVPLYKFPKRDKCFYHVHGKDEHC